MQASLYLGSILKKSQLESAGSDEMVLQMKGKVLFQIKRLAS